MKTKVVVTRNFKGTTPAKYCVAVFGQSPGSAREVEALTLEKVTVVGTMRYSETNDFVDFGCGLVIVAEADVPKEWLAETVPDAVAPLTGIPTGEIEWNGADFSYKGDKDKAFYKCNRLELSPDKMLVTA